MRQGTLMRAAEAERGLTVSGKGTHIGQREEGAPSGPGRERQGLRGP